MAGKSRGRIAVKWSADRFGNIGNSDTLSVQFAVLVLKVMHRSGSPMLADGERDDMRALERIGQRRERLAVFGDNWLKRCLNLSLRLAQQSVQNKPLMRFES